MGTDPRATIGQLSPDGYWRWDGVRWVAAAPAAAPMASPGVAGPLPQAGMQSPPPLTAPATFRPQGARSMLALGAGIVALVAAVLVLAACFIPYVHYDPPSGDLSIFNPGFAGGAWYAIEPVLVILASGAAAILIMVTRGRLLHAVLSGALLALGFQTSTLFLGYLGANLGLQLRPGAIVGVAGGLVLLAGGVMATVSVLTRKSA